MHVHGCTSVRQKKKTLFLRHNLIRSKAAILLGEQFDFICVTLPKKVDNLKEEREWFTPIVGD